MKQVKLVEYKKLARESTSLNELFSLFDQVSNYYELGYIDEDELDEIKGVIWPSIRSLSALKKRINQAMQPG